MEWSSWLLEPKTFLERGMYTHSAERDSKPEQRLRAPGIPAQNVNGVGKQAFVAVRTYPEP